MLIKNIGTINLRTAISTAFAIFVLLTSCKKDKPDDNHVEQPTISILKSDLWRVVASQNIQQIEGNLGGGYKTAAFSTQSENELRWYTLFSTMSYYNGQNEIIVDKNENVKKANVEKEPGFGGDIKIIYGTNTWKINATFNNTIRIKDAYNNNQELYLMDIDPPRIPRWDRFQPSEDGLLTLTNFSGLNSIGHFHFGSKQWKNNTFYGNNFVAVRYKNKTYAICLLRNLAETGIKIYGESDSIVKKQDPNIPSVYSINYPMKELKHLPNMGQPGLVMHAAIYNDNLFIVTDNYQASNTQFSVYKVNLDNLTATLVQTPTHVTSFGIPFADILYNGGTLELDDLGNLYVVERRVENNKPYFSIRKYNVNGGDEIILKENFLQQFTNIHAIKFFNNRLYAAVVYKETLHDEKLDDDFMPYKYHMEIITQK